MRIDKERALYLDLELTCGDLPENEYPQIIQIGIASADLINLKVLRSSTYMVRPYNEFTITEYCTNLTGITREDVLSGHPYNEVINTIQKEYACKKQMCCTWGDDKSALDNTVLNPFKNMLNLSWVYHLAYPKETKRSLSSALEHYGMEFKGRQHNAMYDALNLAFLHLEMIRRMRDVA